MAQFAFFNEGFGKEPPISFTKQQNAFLQSKLVFLDPKRTGKIELGVALQLIRCANLRPPEVQKIMKNCKIDQKALTYDQMKKVIRGIGLSQHQIEPSTVNINANIPNKTAKFYDDDDQDEEEQHQPVSQPIKQQPISQPVKQQQPISQPVKQQPTQPAQLQSYRESIPIRQPAQRVQEQPQSQGEQQNVQPKQQDGNSKIRQFEAYWSKLPTKNNTLDGGEVKNICKNLAQRSNLSKAWKLCCKAHSGSLTKGQFFVFKEIISAPSLPESLSPQMKAAIAHFDNQTTKEKKKDAPPVSPTSNPQLKASQLFQNFGKSQLSATPSAVPSSTSSFFPPNSTSAIASPRPTNVLASPSPATPTVPSQQGFSFAQVQGGISRLGEKVQSGRGSFDAIQQSNEQQIVNFRRGQQSLNNMMGEVEQFVSVVLDKNNQLRSQIDELKTNQNTINQRLNRVMMAMNTVIVRQNAYIDQLLRQTAQRTAMDQQRIATLQQYVAQAMRYHMQREQTTGIYPKTEQPTNQSPSHPQPPANINQQPKEIAVSQPKSSSSQRTYTQPQRNQEKLYSQQTHRQRPQMYQQRPQMYQQRPQMNRQRPQMNRQRPQVYQQRPSQPVQSGSPLSVRKASLQPPPGQPLSPPSVQIQAETSNQLSPESLTTQQEQTQRRIRLKQMCFLGLYHQLYSIAPQEYQQFLAKVSSQPEQRLDAAYANLVAIWEEKQKQTAQQESTTQQSSGVRQHSQAVARRAESDDFSSSNFAGGNAGGEDLFK